MEEGPAPALYYENRIKITFIEDGIGIFIDGDGMGDGGVRDSNPCFRRVLLHGNASEGGIAYGSMRIHVENDARGEVGIDYIELAIHVKSDAPGNVLVKG